MIFYDGSVTLSSGVRKSVVSDIIRLIPSGAGTLYDIFGGDGLVSVNCTGHRSSVVYNDADMTKVRMLLDMRDGVSVKPKNMNGIEWRHLIRILKRMRFWNKGFSEVWRDMLREIKHDDFVLCQKPAVGSPYGTGKWSGSNDAELLRRLVTLTNSHIGFGLLVSSRGKMGGYRGWCKGMGYISYDVGYINPFTNGVSQDESVYITNLNKI